MSEMVGKPKSRRSLGGVRGFGMVAGMFKSGKHDRNDGQWGTIPVSADVFIALRQQALVARSREQWSNNDYVKGFIRIARNNVAGPKGVLVEAQVTKTNGKFDKNVNDAIDAGWNDWGMRGNCEVTGRLSWKQLQRLAVEHAARDGEFIFRKVIGGDAGKYGYQLQIIDPQRLPVGYENVKMDGGGFIRHGIEFNRFGKPVAYHFTSMDEWDAYFYSSNGVGYIRIPADEIIHDFITEMAGQKRGIPWTATSLFRLHHLQGFEDAAVQAARAGASSMAFIKYEEGFGPEADDDVDVASTIEAGPLAFNELPEGASIQEFKPNYPAGEFAAHIKTTLRGSAVGLGVPYNTLADDLEGVNFSSIRSGELTARENWKELQDWLIDGLVQTVRNDWLKMAVLKGLLKTKTGAALSASKIESYSPAHCQGRRWAWVDPKSDATANVTAVRAGFKSISSVIREQGGNPDQVIREYVDDYKRFKAEGMPDELLMVIFGIIPAPEASPNKADESAGKEPATP